MKISVAIVVLTGTAVLGSCSFSQPKMDCMVSKPTMGGGGYAAVYTLKAESADTADKSCGQLIGDTLGLFIYHPTITTPEGVKDDFSRSQLGLRTEDLGLLEGQDPAHPVTSLGDFPVQPDDNGVCAATSLSVAEQHVAATTDTDGNPVPAVDMKVEWSNVQVISLPEVRGSQMTADLTYTDGTCSAKYSVVGMWPSVSCMLADENGPLMNPDGSYQVDESMCAAEADPEHGRPVGSGIDPNFPVTCNKWLGLCVLAGQPPALK